VTDYELYLLPAELAEAGDESLRPLERALAAEEREEPGLLDAPLRQRLFERVQAELPAFAPVPDADPPELSDDTVVIEFWPHYVLVVVPLARAHPGIERALAACGAMTAAAPLVVCDPRLGPRVDPVLARDRVLGSFDAATLFAGGER
jgi:hypothetical protein